MRARRKRTLSDNRGQALLEFLLTSVMLLTTIFAAVQLSVFVYTYSVLAEGAKQGVRYAIVHGSTSSVNSTTDIENAVKRYVNYPGMVINIQYLDAGSN